MELPILSSLILQVIGCVDTDAKVQNFASCFVVFCDSLPDILLVSLISFSDFDFTTKMICNFE